MTVNRIRAYNSLPGLQIPRAVDPKLVLKERREVREVSGFSAKCAGLCFTLNSRETPDTDGKRSRLRSEHVTDGGTSRSQYRATDETRQESEDKQTWDVLDGSSDGLENEEEEEGDDVGWCTSDCWDLGEGSQEEWPNTVPDNEEGKTEGRDDRADAKVPIQAFVTRRVDAISKSEMLAIGILPFDWIEIFKTYAEPM